MIFLKYCVSGFIFNPIDINFNNYESYDITLKGVYQDAVLVKR